MHDSQASISMAEVSKQRLINLCDLIDSAYNVSEIHEHSKKLGHVPIIDINPRRNNALKLELVAESRLCRKIGYRTAETIRYNERSTVERVNGWLKDEFGGRVV